MAMMFWRMASKPSILFRSRCTDLASNKMVGECLESVWTVLDPLASRNLANLVCQMQWNGERGRTFMFQAATRSYEPLCFEESRTDCGASCASRAWTPRKCHMRWLKPLGFSSNLIRTWIYLCPSMPKTAAPYWCANDVMVMCMIGFVTSRPASVTKVLPATTFQALWLLMKRSLIKKDAHITGGSQRHPQKWQSVKKSKHMEVWHSGSEDSTIYDRFKSIQSQYLTQLLSPATEDTL